MSPDCFFFFFFFFFCISSSLRQDEWSSYSNDHSAILKISASFRDNTTERKLTYSAVFSVPSLGAHARAVVALAMQVTAMVAFELVTQSPGPARVTNTPLALTLSVGTFQATYLCKKRIITE